MSETPNKRALSDEKRYAARSTFEKIISGNEITSDEAGIERAFVEHYCELLAYKKIKENGFHTDFLQHMPKLDEDVKASLEEPISVQEIEKAIDELSGGKSPGHDGLGAAFYKAFEADIRHALHEVMSDAYDRKEMPPSFRTAHVVLIPKSEDPNKLLSVAAYRPISLTNVDYKVFMKVLARRLQSVIR